MCGRFSLSLEHSLALRRWVVLAVPILFGPVPSISAQQRHVDLPVMFANDTSGTQVVVDDSELFNFEIQLREEFARKDAPDEIIALAEDEAYRFIKALGLPVALLAIYVHGRQGELRWYTDDTMQRYYHRVLSAREIINIRRFLAENNVDKLPELPAFRVRPDGRVTAIVGGSQYVYVRLNAARALRITIQHPPYDKWDAPRDDPRWRYTKLIEFFERLKAPDKLQVRYVLCRPLKGFELVFAHPDVEVVAVWKNADGLCITLKKKWKSDAPEQHRRLRDGKLGGEVRAPMSPTKYSATVDGVKLRPALSSDDGRWVVGNRPQDGRLLCYDRQRKVFVEIADGQTATKCHPLYYLAVHNAFLLARYHVERMPLIRSGSDWQSAYDLYLFNPTTNKVIDVEELLPRFALVVPDQSLWFQDLPPRLEAVHGRKDLFWVAVPEKSATKVGQFDVKRFQWVHYEWIPNLRFETKHLWVDEAKRKFYVVYKGHLLCVPMSGIWN